MVVSWSGRQRYKRRNDKVMLDSGLYGIKFYYNPEGTDSGTKNWFKKKTAL